MIVAGLTGSIGMGKTTTAGMFRDLGIPVFDSDAVVHDLYVNEAVYPIEQAFPEAVVDGKVDRNRLAEEVVGNPDAFKRLEEIVHPLVRQREREFRNEAGKSGHPLVVLDIPLLFETGRETAVDVVIVVSASAEEQRKRVMARKGMTEEKFNTILSRQMPDDEKRRRADFVVDTGHGLAHAQEQVKRIVESVTAG